MPFGDVPDGVLVGIHKTVAGCNITGRPHTHHTQTGPARQRLVHALVQFRKRVAYVGKAMVLIPQGTLQVLVSEIAELRKHFVHAGLAD